MHRRQAIKKTIAIATAALISNKLPANDNSIYDCVKTSDSLESDYFMTITHYDCLVFNYPRANLLSNNEAKIIRNLISKELYDELGNINNIDKFGYHVEIIQDEINIFAKGTQVDKYGMSMRFALNMQFEEKYLTEPFNLTIDGRTYSAILKYYDIFFNYKIDHYLIQYYFRSI